MKMISTDLSTVPSLATGETYFGFLDFEPEDMKVQALAKDVFHYAHLLVTNEHNVRTKLYLPLSMKNEIIQHYFKLEVLDNEFIYFWAELDHNHVVAKWFIFTLPIQIEVVSPIVEQVVHFDYFFQLMSLFSSFQVKALKDFCWRLFNDPTLILKWVQLPASKQHHHSYAGGLLVHSIECALLSYKNLELAGSISVAETEITVLAALLHDIGKVKTIGAKQHTQTGRLLDHEKLSLLTIADSLSSLAQQWPQGADTLQYLLTWKAKEGFCRYVGGNIIKLADNLSTSLSIRQMAFKDKPDHYHFAQLRTGHSVQYVNRMG